MSVTFQVESVADVWDELVALFLMHWQETERYRHGQPFNPLRERYAYYEREQFYRLYTVRADGRLIGNCGMYVSDSMHTQLKIATEDTLFLHPEFRRGGIAIAFVRYVKDDLIALGAREITFTAKDDRVGRFMAKLDFQPVAVQYAVQVAPTACKPSQPVGELSHDATSRITPAASLAPEA